MDHREKDMNTSKLKIVSAVLVIAALAGVGLLVTSVQPHFADAQGNPDTPATNLTGTVNTPADGQVSLSWDAPDGDNITGYQILRRKVPDQSQFEVVVDDTNSTDTTYVDTITTASGDYVYRVRVIRDGVVRKTSNPFKAAGIVVPGLDPPPPTPYQQLQSAVEEHLEGCLLFQDADGTFRVNSADSKCVNLSHLHMQNCLTGNAVEFLGPPGTLTATYKSSVHRDGTNRYIASHLLGSPIFAPLVETTHVAARITGHNLDQVPRYAVLAEITTVDGTDKIKSSVNSQEFEYHAGSITGPAVDGLSEGQRGNLMSLLDSLRDRVDNILADADYYAPGKCLFLNDERDYLYPWDLSSVPNIDQITNLTPSSEANDEQTASGALDYGPDLDLFRMDMTSDDEFTIQVTATAPDDATDAPFVSGGADIGLDTINPSFRILDQSNDEVVGASSGSISFTPTTTGNYFIEVSHSDENDWVNAGMYEVRVQNVGP